MKKLVAFLVSVLLTWNSYAQINMGNLGTVTNGCGQNFYDSGGASGNYGSSQNFTATFCAPAGQYITFTFSQFALGSGDHLKIYNGSSVASPLIGDYMSASPGQISSSLGGCLTFVFTSDAPVLFLTSNGAGWTAAISCATTVPPPPPPSPGTCQAAQPFCTSTGVTFPASVGTTSQTGPNYGCLSTQPSPGWYYLNIATAGNIQINLSNSANHDIDFAIWGPFNTQAEMCNGTSAAPLDCSYSTAANEQVDIPNAQVGKWYIMIITNYANSATNISALAGDAAGVDGTTNCNILCNMTNLTASPSACNSADNTYSVSGAITVQYPPTSGTLTVSSSCGGSITIPTPWNSPINYTLPNLTANGASCSITATFSADPTCSLTQQITAPAACNSTPVCAISSISATPSSCTSGNLYGVSGQVAFSNAPTTGTLTVSTSCGGSQVFNAPFSSPLNYSISGLSANGSACTVTASFSATTCIASQNYTAPSLPTVNAGVDQVVCANTSVTLSGSGANSYSWTNGVSNGVSFVPTATATYTVTGTSTAGCTATDQVVVTVNALPTVNAGVDQVVCANTSVTLSGSGANSYSWTNGVSNGVSFVPTATATYTVTGTSTAGCTATDQVVVTVNALPTVNAGVDQVVCANTSVTLSGSGANSYSWTNGVSNGVSFVPTATATYTVTGTSTAGCTATDQVVVTVNALPTVDAGVDQVVCANTSVTLSGSGANSYSWTNGVSNGVSFVPTATATYTVTGTSTAGCTATDQVVVTVNALPTVNAGVDQVVCANTSVTLSGSGANSYSWTNGVSNGVSFVPTATATYTVTGTSTAGCTATDQVVVTVNALPTVNAGVDQVVCANTSVTLSGSGANSYSWTNGVSNGVSFVPTATATYTVTGTSTAGCTATDQVVVTVNTTAPINAGNDIVLCSGESATITASGGATYTWDNNLGSSASAIIAPSVTTTYTVNGVDAQGCTGVDQIVVTVNPLPVINAGIDQTVCAGQDVVLSASGGQTYLWDNGISDGVVFRPLVTTLYTVTGTSTLGCTASDQVQITVIPIPSVNAGNDQAVCLGQSVTLTAVSSGQVVWSNAIQNGISFQPQQTNIYVASVSNQGCTSTDSVSILVHAIPFVDAGLDQIICAGDGVTLSGNGASTYTWSNGVTNGVMFYPSVGTATVYLTGYSLEGCSSMDSVTIKVNSLPSPSITNNLSYCTGSSVVLTLNATYAAYNWSTGASTASISATTQLNPISVTVTDQNGCTGVSPVVSVIETNVIYFYDTLTICQGETVSIHGVQQGTQGDYVQVYTSTAGCDSIASVRLIVHALPVVNAGADQSICEGDAIILTASGNGTITWDQNVLNGVSFVPINTVTYTATAQSLSGCISSDQVIVTVLPLPQINAGIDQQICRGETITLTATGGVSYQWNGGIVNGVLFTPSSSQTFTVVGSDGNGCVNSDDIQVFVNNIPVVNAGNDLTICAGESVLLTASGAQSYNWNNNVQNAVPFIPSIGTSYFTVTGTSSAGCSDSDSLLLTVVPVPVVNFSSSATTGCAPLQVTFYNASSNATNCIWTFSDGSVASGCDSISMTFSNAGCYDVTLSTSNQAGCANSFSVNDLVCVQDYAIAAFESSSYTMSELNPVVQFTNSSVGATSFNWSLGDGTPFSTAENPNYNFANTEVGEVQVILIADNSFGCADTTEMTLIMVEDLIYYVPNAFTPDGDNYNQNFKPIFTSGFDPFAYGLFIYDRWGELIFESHDTEIGWNGSYGGVDRVDLVQSGTYTWKIQFKVAINDEHKVVHGHVNVLK